MAFTANVTVNKTAWTVLATGLSTVTVQMQQGGNVRIHIADTADVPSDASDEGILIGRLSAGVASSLSAGGLQAGGGDVTVWGKSASDNEEIVTVLAY